MANVVVDSNLLILRFTGDVSPLTASASEVGRILIAAEEALRAIVDEELLDTVPIRIHATEIRSRSLGIGLQPSRDSGYVAFDRLAETINRSDYDHAPDKAVEGIRTLHRYGKEWGSTLEFYPPRRRDEPIAVLVPAAIIEQTPRISGGTSIYGEVIRLGGRAPRIRMKLLSGEEISCKAPKSLVQKLGSSLYRTVGLAGTAEWETDHYSLVSFTAEELIEYDDGANIGAVLDDLSRQYGKHFEDVADVDAYVRSLRDDD